MKSPEIPEALACDIVAAADLGLINVVRWFLDNALLDAPIRNQALTAAAHRGHIHIRND